MKKTIAILLLASYGLFSAQENIETDRPDQTESAALVPKNYLQIESGFLYEKENSGENFSHPTINWRYGVNDFFEVHLVTELVTEHFSKEKSSGLSPLTFGLKVKLTEETKVLPKISFLANLQTSKWGSKNFQTPHVAPSFRFLFQQTLSDRLQLGYNVGAEWNGETPDADGIYTLSLAYALTEKLGSFAEVYGFINKYEKADHRIDGGLTYLVTKDLQADLSAGMGLSKISPDYFISAGISYRFPLK